jgi:methylaspartate ammonia-lyase
MSRINTFGPSGEAERADLDETVINGAPYDGDQAIRSGAENPGVSVDRPDAPIAEEIKRRQVSLAVRYVAALRAR